MSKTFQLKTNSCPVCHSQDTIEWYPENIDVKNITFNYSFSPDSQRTFRVVRCQKCTHVYCSPLPRKLYKNYEEVVDKEYLRHEQSRKQTARLIFETIHKYKSTGRLLDVGCATGDFLEIARDEGYSAEGLELSHWSSKLARGKGFTVYRESIETLADRYNERYDIITMWGVIEHFEYPEKEMEYLYKLLKSGGLLVLWTGNVDGIVSRILKRSWWYWQGQHIQYFTEKSLNHLAMGTGFAQIETKIYPLAVTYEQMENSLSRYTFKKYILPIVKLVFMARPIWYLYLPGEMFWIARKAKRD